MTTSGAMPSGVTSRDLIGGTLACPAFGAERRRISVGILSLFGWLGKRFGREGPDLGVLREQMAIAAEHAFRFAAPRRMKRVEDALKNVSALRPTARFGFVSLAVHRHAPAYTCEFTPAKCQQALVTPVRCLTGAFVTRGN